MAYKVLDSNLRSCHGGEAQWTVGQKKSVEGDLVPCEKGIHVCRDERDVLSWIGEVICPCEHSEEYIDRATKRVVRWACIGEPNPYWNERTARHFACDCAEFALPYAQDDQRELLQAVVDIARAYADRPEEWAEERKAAQDSARDALAIVAAGAAAEAAIWAAVDAAGAAGDVAWGAAWAAARAAALNAAVDVAQAAGATARDDLAAILATYLDGTNEWLTIAEND